MGKVVDLNCDMGESFGRYTLGIDYEVMDEISSANIACGFHAGDFMVLAKTVKWAVEKNVGIGAHPGYPDLQGFGRRNMDLSAEEVENLTLYQIGAIHAFAKANGARLQHVKPHGNFYIQIYNNAMKGDPSMAQAVGRAVQKFDDSLIVLALAGTEMAKIWKGMGLRVAEEVFPDREYNADGTLVSRKVKGAVITDHTKVVERAVKMVKDGAILSIDGKPISDFRFDTMCVHGDNPETLQVVRDIVQAFKKNDIEVKAMGSFIA